MSVGPPPLRALASASTDDVRTAIDVVAVHLHAGDAGGDRLLRERRAAVWLATGTEIAQPLLTITNTTGRRARRRG